MLKLNEFIHVPEASKMLGISAMNLRSWVEQGKVKHYRHPLNGRPLFKKEDIEDFLKSIVMTIDVPK